MTELAGEWRWTHTRVVHTTIRLTPDLLSGTLQLWRKTGRRWLVVVDANVDHHFGTRIRSRLQGTGDGFVFLPWQATEKDKTLETIARLASHLDKHHLGRFDGVVGVGGGVFMDLVGVTASLYLKGVPYVLIPTTLLAIVDAAVAIKRAVNAFAKKNLLGIYNGPELVLATPEFLPTLPHRHVLNGFAEIGKVGQAADATLWDLTTAHHRDLVDSKFTCDVAQHVFARAISRMAEHHAENPDERQTARWPDHGHNAGPKLEMLELGSLLHGETVSICMAYSAALGLVMDTINEPTARHLVGWSRAVGLPVWHPKLDDVDFLLNTANELRRKRGGHVNWTVIDREPGAVGFVDPSAKQFAMAGSVLRRLASS